MLKKTDFILASLLIFFTINCARKSQIIVVDKSNLEPQILFVQMELIRTNENDGNIQSKLISKTLRKGFLKLEPTNNYDWEEPEKYRIKFLNKEKETINTVFEANVLDKSYEYLAENNQYKIAIVKSNKADLFIRIPYVPEFYWLKLERINSENKVELISITKLN
jgi:hypothetical protein